MEKKLVLALEKRHLERKEKKIVTLLGNLVFLDVFELPIDKFSLKGKAFLSLVEVILAGIEHGERGDALGEVGTAVSHQRLVRLVRLGGVLNIPTGAAEVLEAVQVAAEVGTLETLSHYSFQVNKNRKSTRTKI
jgi:uncharacterized protein YbbC (DUF1343 family)